MKKIISALLCAVFIFMIFIPAFASEESLSEPEYFEDGSYIVSEIKDSSEKESESDFLKIFELFKKLINMLLGKNTVTKTKYVYYYDSNGVKLWEIYLEAKFTYSKKGAICDKASVSSNVLDSDWKVIRSSASKSENTAKGEFAVRQSKLGVPLKTIEKTLTLSCDKNGNVK